MSQFWDCLRLSPGLKTTLPWALALVCSGCSAESAASESRAAGSARGTSTLAAAGSRASVPGAAAIGGNGAANPSVLLPSPGTSSSGTGNMKGPTPGSAACEVVQLVTDPVIPEMMIVLDRSGSMTEGGRWEPSVAAVRSVTAKLQARIHFGLALFPDPDAAPPTTGPVVNNVTDCFTMPNPQLCIEQFNAQDSDEVACAPGKIFVPVAENSASMIAGVLDKTKPFGGTPTSDTLQQILTSYGSAEPSPDMKPHPKFVLLVTDGMPTCPAGHGSDINQADINASNKAVEALAANNVKTYVIGYDTSGPDNAMLASTLDGFAQRGGTGDMMHRTVEDEASLLNELTRITIAIASCSFELNSPPERADHVLVRLDGKQVNLNEPDGFALVGDRSVELRGASCMTYREGNHLIDAQVLCEIVQPQ
jgi:hypothetical protein